jgi:hypothetical protein
VAKRRGLTSGICGESKIANANFVAKFNQRISTYAHFAVVVGGAVCVEGKRLSGAIRRSAGFSFRGTISLLFHDDFNKWCNNFG